MIELHQCTGYQSITEVLRCTQRENISIALKPKDTDFLRNYVTKHIILSQACLAFMSILMISFKKKPILTLFWVWCKVLIGTTELIYIPAWSSDLISQSFKTWINPVWFAASFMVYNAYMLLVALGYYSEHAETTASYDFALQNKNPTFEDNTASLHIF